MSNRDMYIQKAKAKFDNLEAELKRLEAEGEEMTADAEIKRREHMKLLRRQMATVEDRIEKLHAASEEAWHDVKNGFETAWNDLSETFRQAQARYASDSANS